MKTLKLNWGAGIAVSYLGFVAMILMLVAMSMRENIDLVTSQYYVEELKFQSKIDKIQRARSLTKAVSWKMGTTGLEIEYPSTDVSGTIRLYCPANSKNDREFRIDTRSGKQTLPISQVPSGRYQLQIDWKRGNETFWNEGVVVFN